MVEVMELWRTIPSFPEYEASNKGRIRRISSGRILNPAVASKNGAFQVNFDNGWERGTPDREGGRRKKQIFRYIHRLVAECWMLGFDSSKVVRFKDGNPKHTAIWNLEQGTNGARPPDAD